MKKGPKWINYVLLLLLLLAVLAVYVIKITAEIKGYSYTIIEERISELAEFLLTFGIGLMVQKLSSYYDLRNQIKDFALSAQRRVKDNLKSINRLLEKIRYYKSANGPSEELAVIEVSVENLLDTVASSVYDWIHIIGDELEKIDEISELEERKRRISETDKNEDVENVQMIDKKISELRSKLPYILRSDIVEKSTHYHNFAELDLSNELIEYYCNQVENDGKIKIRAKTGRNFSESEKHNPNNLGPFSIMVVNENSQYQLLVFDRDSNYFGEIVNPLQAVSRKDFSITLFTILASIYGYTDTLSITPSFSTIIHIPLDVSVEIENEEVIFEIVAHLLDFAFG